jgi:hypothetical protein
VVLITETVHFSRVYLCNAATAPLTPGCLSSVYYISSANYVLCCCATFVMHRITHSVRIHFFFRVISVKQALMLSENYLLHFFLLLLGFFVISEKKQFINNKLG